MTRPRLRRSVLACVPAVLLLGNVPSQAEERNRPSARSTGDRYSTSVGVYSLQPRTILRLDTPGGTLGTTIDLEDDLGVDGQTLSASATFGVRFGRRHRLEVEYFELSRSGVRENRRTLQFGDLTYDAGLRLETFFDTEVVRLGYVHSFPLREGRELGVQAGIHVTRIDTGIRAVLAATARETEQFADATAPLPVIGLQGLHRLAPKWMLFGSAQIFRFEAGDYEGNLDHVMLAFEHATLTRVGLGLALDFFRLDVDSASAGFQGALRLQFSGPRLYAHARF